jgi:mRNA interferase MazF
VPAVRRGDVCVVDLAPAVGSEAGKRRPAIVVSSDRLNETSNALGRGMVTVVPLSSNTDRILSFQVLVEPDGTGLSVPSKAQAEQVRSVDVRRVSAVLGAVSDSVLGRLEDALRLHLEL